MRLAIVAALAALPSVQTQEATIYAGTVDPVDGFGWILSPWGPDGPLPNPTYFLPDGYSMKVTLDIASGVIAEANTWVRVGFAYDDWTAEYPGDKYPDANTGNSFSWMEACHFNSSSPDGCFLEDFAPSSEYGPSQRITDFTVGQRTLSYEINRPLEFNNCDHQFVGMCSNFWSVANEQYEFKIAAQRPVSYTLTFGDPIRSAVPEPASWAMMIAGFGLAGATLRRKNYKTKLGVA